MKTYPIDAPSDRFDHLPQKTFKVTISPYSPATSWFSTIVVIFLFLVIPNLLVLFIPFLIGLAVLAVNRIKRITHLEVSTGPEGIAFTVILPGDDPSLDRKKFTWDELEQFRILRGQKSYIFRVKLTFQGREPVIIGYPEHDKLFDYLKKYFPEKRWSFFKWLSEKVGVSFPPL